MDGNSSNDQGLVYQYDVEMVQEIDTRTILHWNYRNLREIPREVLDHGIHLKEMYLKRNNIRTLPPEIGSLANLTNLYLIGNQLSSLPPEMGQLRSLKVLDLSQNRLSELPASMGDLCELQQLLLTQNRIQRLPPEMKELKNLIFLELSGNRLRELPEALINGLVSLQELAMDQNPIFRIPRSISSLQRLRYISVCHANLSFLPAVPFHALQLLNSYENGENHQFAATASYRKSVPQFRFDGNPKLNYLPFWIPQFLGPEIECFGCGVEEDTISFSEVERTVFSSDQLNNSESPGIQLYFKGKPHTLRFDEDLCGISRSSTKEPCSLLELCLRQVYMEATAGVAFSSKSKPTISQSSMPTKYLHGSRNEYDLLNIPSNLTRLLTTGPVSQCFQCFEPIFTQAWPLVFVLPEGNPNPEQNENPVGHLLGRNILQNTNSVSLSLIFLCSSNCSSKANDKGMTAKSSYPDLNFITDNKLDWL